MKNTKCPSSMHILAFNFTFTDLLGDISETIKVGKLHIYKISTNDMFKTGEHSITIQKYDICILLYMYAST